MSLRTSSIRPFASLKSKERNIEVAAGVVHFDANTALNPAEVRAFSAVHKILGGTEIPDSLTLGEVQALCRYFSYLVNEGYLSADFAFYPKVVDCCEDASAGFELLPSELREVAQIFQSRMAVNDNQEREVA